MQDVLTELLPDVAPHQAFMVWNLETIQRRLVGQQLPAARQAFHAPPGVLLQTSDGTLALLASNGVGLSIFARQRLFKQFSPELESLPHAEHVPERIPRNIPGFSVSDGMGSATLWGESHFEKLGSGAQIDLENHWYIWAMWHGITPKEKQRELERLLGTATLFRNHVFGWNAPRPDDAVWTRGCTATTHRQLLLFSVACICSGSTLSRCLLQIMS